MVMLHPSVYSTVQILKGNGPWQNRSFRTNMTMPAVRARFSGMWNIILGTRIQDGCHDQIDNIWLSQQKKQKKKKKQKRNKKKQQPRLHIRLKLQIRSFSLTFNRFVADVQDGHHDDIQYNMYPLPLSGQIQQMKNGYFLIFSRKNIGFDISCKLSYEETNCLKCQSLFSGKNKKYFKLLYAEIHLAC